MFIYMQAVFVASLILAFIKGWELALVCLTSLPLSLICIGIIGCVSFMQIKNNHSIANGLILAIHKIGKERI